MQNDSRKPRRQKVAPGVYRQDGALFANYREPGTRRSRFTKLKATTPRAATRERESILAALREGRRAPRSQITLAAFCREWLDPRGGRVADRTLEYDEGQVQRIVAVLGLMRLQDVTVRDVRRLLAETALLAEWTRYGMVRTLRQVMKRSFAPLVVLLAFTGLRIREALGLRWADVDLDQARIRLRWQLAVDDRSYVPVKTDAGARDVPILPQLRRRLVEHRLASAWTRPGDPVFASSSGRAKGYRNARRALEKISAELEIDLASHDFRRSLASYLIIAARADEGAVTAVLGHANIEITRRLYAADWRDAEERNTLLLRQLADAGIGQ
jgi:integrase